VIKNNNVNVINIKERVSYNLAIYCTWAINFADCSCYWLVDDLILIVVWILGLWKCRLFQSGLD